MLASLAQLQGGKMEEERKPKSEREREKGRDRSVIQMDSITIMLFVNLTYYSSHEVQAKLYHRYLYTTLTLLYITLHCIALHHHHHHHLSR